MSQSHDDLIAEAAKITDPEPLKPEDADAVVRLRDLSAFTAEKLTQDTTTALETLIRGKGGVPLRELSACYAHIATVRIYAEESAAKEESKQNLDKLARTQAAEFAVLELLAGEVKG